MEPQSDNYILIPNRINRAVKNESRNISNSTNQESIDNNRIVLGRITECVDPECQGWLVDSVLGKYIVECLDPRHNVTKKQVEKGGQSIIPTKGTHTTVTREINLDDH